jgi:hypothetical protein
MPTWHAWSWTDECHFTSVTASQCNHASRCSVSGNGSACASVWNSRLSFSPPAVAVVLTGPLARSLEAVLLLSRVQGCYLAMPGRHISRDQQRRKRSVANVPY